MKHRSKLSLTSPRHLVSISVIDESARLDRVSSNSLRPSVAPLAKTFNNCGVVDCAGAEMPTFEAITMSNSNSSRRPSLPIQGLAGTAASSLQQQQHLLARRGSAKAAIGERPRLPHQHQCTSHSRQLSATAAAGTRGHHSLTVGGQPRGPRPLAHSAMIAAAAAAHAAANSAAVLVDVGHTAAAASSSLSSYGAAGGCNGGGGATAAACTRQQVLLSGNGGGHSNRHFSVKRVDEDQPSWTLTVGGNPAEFAASNAPSEETFRSKSELLKTRRQQQLQHLRSSNTVQTVNEEEQPMNALESDAASGCCEEGSGGFNEDVDCDDICPLCDTCVKNSRGRTTGLQLDDNPGVIRWQKLPCNCPDRYLHLSCLETSFFDDAVYKGGRRRLIIACQVCKSQLLIRRNRGRRTCDHTACLSFARHLLSVLLIAGLLVAFGLWSLFHPLDGRPTVLNVGLVSTGGLAVVLFALYEFWLLHGRFDFVISRLNNGRGTSASPRHTTATDEDASSMAKTPAANNNNNNNNNDNSSVTS